MFVVMLRVRVKSVCLKRNPFEFQVQFGEIKNSITLIPRLVNIVCPSKLKKLNNHINIWKWSIEVNIYHTSDSLVVWKQGKRKWFAYGLARGSYFGRFLRQWISSHSYFDMNFCSYSLV